MSFITHALALSLLGSAVAGASEIPDFHCFNHEYRSTDIVVTKPSPGRVRIVLSVYRLWEIESFNSEPRFVPEVWHQQMNTAPSKIIIEGDVSFEASLQGIRAVQIQMAGARVQYISVPHHDPEQLIGEETIPKLVLTTSTNISTNLGERLILQIQEWRTMNDSVLRELSMWAQNGESSGSGSSCNLLPPSP